MIFSVLLYKDLSFIDDGVVPHYALKRLLRTTVFQQLHHVIVVFLVRHVQGRPAVLVGDVGVRMRHQGARDAMVVLLDGQRQKCVASSSREVEGGLMTRKNTTKCNILFL